VAELEAAELEQDGEHVRARLAFAEGTSFYGTGEAVGPLERSGRSVTLWNTDAFEYEEGSTPLYQSHPYVLAVRPDGSALGLLADTIRRGTIEIGAAAAPLVELAFEGEPFDLYAISGAHPRDVTRALAALVGRIELPPLWALGYHQCRWSYASADELRALAAEFRRRGIPCDGLWLDIDYMDRFRPFTSDPRTFPDLRALTGALRARGFRTVAILDPGVAVDSELAREGLARDLFVKDAEGAPATGEVWPGACHFPDFTRCEVREWWSEHARAFVERSGLDGLWNDMNEPSVRDGPGRTLPDSCRHAGTDGSGGDHARWHNLYGQLMVEATREGLVRARPERRPFLLTRSNHVSGSRLAATWTGDNRATWDHLRWSIPMVLNLGLSGQPFGGPDAGGFNGDPDREHAPGAASIPPCASATSSCTKGGRRWSRRASARARTASRGIAGAVRRAMLDRGEAVSSLFRGMDSRFFWICLGGAAGTAARYWLGGWAPRVLGAALPWGTLAVNVLGSFLIGAVMHVGLTTELLSPTLRIALTVGVLGGFTTYSSFSFETLRLLQDGAWALALLYVAGTLLGCLGACALGFGVARWLAGS
jgi:protein CrcB